MFKRKISVPIQYVRNLILRFFIRYGAEYKSTVNDVHLYNSIYCDH